MRRVSALFLLCCSVALAGFAPKPKPTPTPTPAAAATPAALPLVVVYPFNVSSEMQPDTGAKAAQLFVQQMNGAGGVDAITAPASVKRADFLTYATSHNAAYYVAGYMTPLGAGVSLVEQVVATQSGTILFGQTVQIQSLADAAAQAVFVRDGIVAREQAFNAPIQQSSTQSTPAPAASNQANISNLASGLFKHHGKTTPAPHGSIVKPAKGVLVVQVDGGLSKNELSTATTDLFYALNQRFNVHMASGSSANLAKEANGICGSARDNTIAGGVLSSQQVRHGLFDRTQYTFTLNVYTCFGAKLATQSSTGDSVQNAVAKAASAYAQGHPQNV